MLQLVRNNQILFALVVLLLIGCKEDTKNDDVQKSDSINQQKVVVEQQSPFITRNDVEDGDYEERYSNGILKIKGLYSQGRKHGTWMSFYEDGTLWSEGNFVQGKREGRAITYRPNGKKYYEGFYTNDKASGVWTYYDADGIKVKEVNNDQ